jgi:hypothetical protein
MSLRLSFVSAVALVFTIIAGCQSSQERNAQRSEAVERARAHVLAQLQGLDSASREMVRTNNPQLSYVGAPFGGSYWFRWQISSNRVAAIGPCSLESAGSDPVHIEQSAPTGRY